MVVLTADVVRKRLQDVTSPSQEQIETMSLWIMHYKDKTSIDLIVEGWISCFKSGTEAKRIALFYVMNDVVQKAKMKHADTLIPAFQPAVLTAVGVGKKQEKVKVVMKRCIQIFKSRSVFTAQSINAMQNLLDAEDGYDADDGALEVDSEELLKKITNFVASRSVITDMMSCLRKGSFDYKLKCKKDMRDREAGAHMLQEVHEVIDTMVNVRHAMEVQKKKMVALSETLELAKRVFLHQKREVLVVEEAYVNFRDGIKAVHTDLTEMEEKGVYPGAATPMTDDEIYGHSADHDSFRKASNAWGGGDNNVQVDMEMDEEERPQAPMMKPSLQALVGIASQPSLQSRIMQLGLKKIADGDEEMLQHSQKAANDFSRPPPAVFGAQAPPTQSNTTNATVSSFGLSSLAQPAASNLSLPSDPRKRVENEIPSQYGMTYQQQPQVPALSAQQTVYQGHFETRDPRLLAAQQQQQQHVQAVQQPQIAGYTAQFEPRDPRLAQMAQQQPTSYQATFDAPAQPTGAYHGRFDQKAFAVPPPPTNGGAIGQIPAVNQYQQQQQIQQQTAAFMNAPPGNQDYDGRGANAGNGYSSHGAPQRAAFYHEERRGAAAASSAPYSNPRGDRWRNGGAGSSSGGGGGGSGGYNDRNRSGGRDNNWRGGGNNNYRGNYNRY